MPVLCRYGLNGSFESHQAFIPRIVVFLIHFYFDHIDLAMRRPVTNPSPLIRLSYLVHNQSYVMQRKYRLHLSMFCLIPCFT